MLIMICWATGHLGKSPKKNDKKNTYHRGNHYQMTIMFFAPTKQTTGSQVPKRLEVEVTVSVFVGAARRGAKAKGGNTQVDMSSSNKRS